MGRRLTHSRFSGAYQAFLYQAPPSSSKCKPASIQVQEGKHVFLITARHIVDSPADTADRIVLKGVVKYLGLADLIVGQLIKCLPVYDAAGTGQRPSPILSLMSHA